MRPADPSGATIFGRLVCVGVVLAVDVGGLVVVVEKPYE